MFVFPYSSTLDWRGMASDGVKPFPAPSKSPVKGWAPDGQRSLNDYREKKIYPRPQENSRKDKLYIMYENKCSVRRGTFVVLTV